MAQIPFPSIDDVLVSADDTPLPPSAQMIHIEGTRLGDLPLGTLIRYAATCPCTNIELPEEAPYGDDSDYF